ncbi:Guanosine-diphosphatase [Stygiomarasmius scandens]|uniref:guanosine-diphosphatase n=1 Tax=Marasmiellus scandens TaxID=2682957 RepID=A0ABR1J6V9_9AGAR
MLDSLAHAEYPSHLNSHHDEPQSSAHSTGTQNSTQHARSRLPTSASADTETLTQESHSLPSSMLSPRSSNYERLEGGLGPSKMGTSKKFAWKKFAIGAAVIIGLVWVFGPRETRQRLPWPSYGETEAEIEQPTNTRPAETHTNPPPVHPPIEAEVGSSEPHHPSSFEEDEDPSRTTYCSSPSNPSARLVQYALMIDAGSTGSRIHIYKFNNCGSAPSYEYEVFKQTNPGLSSYSGQPEDAAKSLDVLLDEAVKVIPSSLHSCTPVAVKATAGLRLLPGSQSQDILKAVEARLKAHYPFQLHEPNGVVVMDGKDEGVYAWITANYLLNTIRVDTPADTPTYAVLDLGGASTQIVFEPVFSKPDSSLESGEHKYDLDFGGKKRVLYQHSYLGYGLMRARKHVHQLVDFMHSIRTSSPDQTEEGETPVVGNPCLAKGTKRPIEIEEPTTGKKKWVMMDGEQIGSFEACNRVIELVMAKDSICEVKPCSFNGVYQPSLLDAFPTGKVLLLSYFFDRIDPLLSAELTSTSTSGTDEKLTVSTIAALAQDICQGEETWTKRWGTNTELMKELRDRPEWCLDLTFMHGLLRLGYEFEDMRDVVIGKQIAGTELGWCLGATIAMVGGDLKCRL